MNTKRCFPGIVVASVLAVVQVAAAQPAIPATTSVSITSVGVSSNRVTVHDAANRVWVVQQSTNLTDWSEIDVWKVHNGNFHRSLLRSPTENGFYRVIADATRQQDLLSTTADALKLPGTLFNYAAPVLPPGYLTPQITGQDNTPPNNPVTDAGATLGRALFYDKRLSTNGTVSCSSCHQQQAGFSDPRKFSVGFNGGLTDRNSMGLANARYYPRGRFFWDERAATLEDQVLQPIQNSVEMGMTLPALVTRISAEPFYTNLFANTFGTTEVTTNRISQALAQFIRSMVSTQTKYDAGVASGFANFTQQENLGRQIFFGQVGNATCATCHGTDTFTAPNIFNNGLEFPFVDRGVGAITGRAQDEGLFKTPSLRNIALTAPYMHDGRFATLEEVVEFYNSGVVNNPNLAPQLRNPPGQGAPGAPRRLNLTVQQKAALVAFLRTISDTAMATDPKFSDPFNYGD